MIKHNINSVLASFNKKWSVRTKTLQWNINSILCLSRVMLSKHTKVPPTK